MELLFIFIGLGAIISAVLLYSAFSWGLVCAKFWAWFVLPIFLPAFPQLPELGFWEAAGLMFFIGLFRNHSSTSIKKEYRDDKNSLGITLLMPWLTLAIGWVFYTIFI